LSAHRTNEIRKEVAKKAVRDGFETCIRRGVKPTITNIAKVARMSRTTVYKYMDEESVHYGLSGNYTVSYL
jgi:predicted transcriptional regulator YheO